VSNAVGPSIVNLRHSQTDAAVLVPLLHRVLRSHQRDLQSGCLLTIDDGGVRVHLLPVGRQADV